MKVTMFEVDKDLIKIVYDDCFGVVVKINVEGNGVINQIYDYCEHKSGEVSIVTYKVDINIKRLFKTEHFKTECHKIAVSTDRLRTWVDGIKTRDMKNWMC